ncbi:hypothetical protein P43SY_008174 [Pythium insidiosum]|uniref:non-specific serine/threonine protein kinase n=1 Tax=Pythium insidiosum TaxID=114742 RepID=A0AAD5LF64_PYTIN|nr:hypothetical protein P43SY_008174 [Pythium insidiosum]
MPTIATLAPSMRSGPQRAIARPIEPHLSPTTSKSEPPRRPGTGERVSDSKLSSGAEGPLSERLLRLISADVEDEHAIMSDNQLVDEAEELSFEEDASNQRQQEPARMVSENDILEWENPSYLVKNLDTGESYHVEEIDQQFNLVTLEAVVRKHEHSTDHSPSSTSKAEHHDENKMTSGQTSDAPELPSSTYLLSLYTADETADIEIEDDPDELSRTRSANVSSIASDDVIDPTECRFQGCTVLHQRPSGFCADHEIIAKEEEDSRAQAQYLIPLGARAEFVKISSHGFVYDASNRLYTVYVIEMRCAQSGATWNVYRRYQEFKALNDCLRPLGVRVPLLPPKKLLGSFEADFIAKRQAELAEWLRNLLTFDRVDDATKNPHLIEDVRKFLTAKADQPPFLLERLPLKRSRFFGTPLSDDVDDEGTATLSKHTTLQDFKMIQVIGRGSFGKVVLVGHKETKKLYAMKILSKENIVKRKQVEHTRTERRVLGYTKHPFIVGLHFAFQTPQRLYFVLDYCPGGELFYHLSRMKKLPEHMACFYAAEITLALEHLHSLGVVYRDLKPENILLTKDGHIKLADFGLAKEGIRDGVNGTNSLCGTPEYLPPEILDRLGHGTAVDWWNLGMVLYEMLTGLPPWYTNDRKKLFERLRSARLHFPPYVSRRAEALIRQLLNRNPAERLGSKGAHQVKSHLFFENIDWTRLAKKQIPPPFRPCHTAMNDGEAPLNFEAEFTRLPLPSVEAHDGFTYENPSLLESVAKEEV